MSNAEREPVIERLKQAYAEGRLDHDEFDMRIHLAMTAKTYADLATVTTDLSPAPAASVGACGRTGESTAREHLLAALAHGSGPFTAFVGPLLFMLISGRRSPFIRKHAVEALNFQLTLLAIVVVTFGVGAALYAVTWIIAAIAALAALAGHRFHYPFTLRLIH